MPVVRRTERKKKPTVRQNKAEVTLPENVSEPASNLSDYSTLLFGEKKIGKTTLASRFPDAMFLMFEPGGKALRIFQRPILKWEEFLGYLDLLESDNRFRTVVIDTIDLCYARCFEFTCRRLGIDHPQEEAYGKGWDAIKMEFAGAINRLLRLKKGMIFISHDVIREVTMRDGTSFDRILPSMPKQAASFMEGVVDIWAYYGYWGKERYLVLCGNETIGAGNRLQEEGEHFYTPEGERVIAIPMGKTSQQAYQNVVDAFNNKQQDHGGGIFKSGKQTERKSKV